MYWTGSSHGRSHCPATDVVLRDSAWRYAAPVWTRVFACAALASGCHASLDPTIAGDGAGASDGAVTANAPRTVQRASDFTRNGSTVKVTFSNPITAGDLLIVVASTSADRTLGVPSDSQGSPCTLI